MVKVMNFQESLERDLTRLSAEIKEQKLRPEAQALPEREIVRRSLESISPPQGREGGKERTPSEETQRESALPSYLRTDASEPQVKLEVERLVDLVFHEGLETAIGAARKCPPFIEDAFHDALVDRLLPELQKRGIVH